MIALLMTTGAMNASEAQRYHLMIVRYHAPDAMSFKSKSIKFPINSTGHQIYDKLLDEIFTPEGLHINDYKITSRTSDSDVYDKIEDSEKIPGSDQGKRIMDIRLTALLARF